MRRLTVLLTLAALTLGLAGCGGSDKARTPGGPDAPKAPDVPKDGP